MAIEASARGRTARGEERRQALVEAAAGVLEDEGFGAVTHRTVAARAGLPLAATTYYFSSLEDLVARAMEELGAGYLRNAESLLDSWPSRRASPARMAAAIVTVLAGPDEELDRARLLTFYERYIQAGRHPAYRDVVTGLTERLTQIARELLDRSGRPHTAAQTRRLIALADGLLISALVSGGEDPLDVARGELTAHLSPAPTKQSVR